MRPATQLSTTGRSLTMAHYCGVVNSYIYVVFRPIFWVWTPKMFSSWNHLGIIWLLEIGSLQSMVAWTYLVESAQVQVKVSATSDDLDWTKTTLLEAIRMAISDKDLTCRDCGAVFTFTAGEQEFFNSKGFTNEPSRCPACRSARRNQGGGYGGGGGGGFGGGQREMHPAVCAQCGIDTEVPFLPRGDKPVYCSDCFSSMRR